MRTHTLHVLYDSYPRHQNVINAIAILAFNQIQYNHDYHNIIYIAIKYNSKNENIP